MKLLRALPALPVKDVEAAVLFYNERLGFSVKHKEDFFARLERDDLELHLWAASDQDWRERVNFVEEPVCSGAESFIAGTSSCRIEVIGVDGLYAEMARADVLHPGDPGPRGEYRLGRPGVRNARCRWEPIDGVSNCGDAGQR